MRLKFLSLIVLCQIVTCSQAIALPLKKNSGSAKTESEFAIEIRRISHTLMVVDSRRAIQLIAPIGIGKGGIKDKKSMADFVTPTGTFEVDLILYANSTYNRISDESRESVAKNETFRHITNSSTGLAQLFENMNRIYFVAEEISTLPDSIEPEIVASTKDWLVRHPRTILLLETVIEYAANAGYPNGVSVPEVTGRLFGYPPGTRTNSPLVDGYVRQLANERVALISIAWFPTNTAPMVQRVRHLKPTALGSELAELGILQEITEGWRSADRTAQSRIDNHCAALSGPTGAPTNHFSLHR